MRKLSSKPESPLKASSAASSNGRPEARQAARRTTSLGGSPDAPPHQSSRTPSQKALEALLPQVKSTAAGNPPRSIFVQEVTDGAFDAGCHG
jgi:hypothetical protein